MLCVKRKLKPFFPSYIFIESEVPSPEFFKRTCRIIGASKDIIQLLRYGDIDEISMGEHEICLLLNLYNNDYCIEVSNGIIIENIV